MSDDDDTIVGLITNNKTACRQGVGLLASGWYRRCVVIQYALSLFLFLASPDSSIFGLFTSNAMMPVLRIPI